MEQQEQVEWNAVNSALQNHGFKPLRFADPVENKNIPDLVLLDRRSALDMRSTIRTMLSDSDRRQALIQELIEANRQLKQESQEMVALAARRSQRVTELEGLLDVVTAKVQQLEDRCLGNAVRRQGQTQQLQMESHNAQRLCEALQQQLCEQKEETSQLQRKLHFTIREEEKRLARQKQALRNLSQPLDQQQAPTKQQMLDVIDFYETQVMEQQSELSLLRRETSGSPASEPERAGRSAAEMTTSNLQSMVKGLEEELQQSRGREEKLRSEMERLNRDLESRPTLKELRICKHKLRLLEGADMPRNQQRNLRFMSGDKARGEHLGGRTDHSAHPHHYHLLKEVKKILSNPNAPLRLRRQKLVNDENVSDFQNILPSLELWAQQLGLLKELQRGLNKLSAKLMPSHQAGDGHEVGEAVKVEDLMLQVDTMLEHLGTSEDLRFISPTKHTLSSIVSHFQKLFDVPSHSGVFTRMNEVYARLGEMTNATSHLRHILDLSDKTPLTELVNCVETLASSSGDAVTSELHSLLRDTDIDEIIVKLKQHQEFFPTFHALVVDILDILGVTRVDDILPALRSLTRG